MNILILSCGTRCLLVDYFKERSNGFDKVVTTDCSPASPALYRSDKYYIVPRMKEPSYLPTLLEICKTEQIDAVLPLQEDELILISEHKKDFETYNVLPIISDVDIVNLCKDKYALQKKLADNDILTVPSYLLDDIGTAIEEFKFPLFMKPRLGAGSVSSYVVRSRDFAEVCAQNENEEFIIQPFVEGEEYGVNAYIDFVSGKLVKMFVLKKIRMRAGETEKSVSVKNADIEKIVERLCSVIPFKGPIDIDIMEKDGKYYILEINPRFGGAYPHTHECGVNFIKLLSNNAAGNENDVSLMNYEEGTVAFRYMTISTIEEKELAHEIRS